MSGPGGLPLSHRHYIALLACSALKCPTLAKAQVWIRIERSRLNPHSIFRFKFKVSLLVKADMILLSACQLYMYLQMNDQTHFCPLHNKLGFNQFFSGISLPESWWRPSLAAWRGSAKTEKACCLEQVSRMPPKTKTKTKTKTKKVHFMFAIQRDGWDPLAADSTSHQGKYPSNSMLA